jgi:hypothetical protein
MDIFQNNSNTCSPRENFLLHILQKVISEYKLLVSHSRRAKLFKIVEILEISSVPGETRFAIQLTNKNCILKLTAADIISNNYNLNDFSNFHAELIRQASQGKLVAFLQLSDNTKSTSKIISKKIDKNINQFIFTIETENKRTIVRTANEVSQDKDLLSSLDIIDIYDIGYTQGSESILKEKISLLLAKNET